MALVAIKCCISGSCSELDFGYWVDVNAKSGVLCDGFLLELRWFGIRLVDPPPFEDAQLWQELFAPTDEDDIAKATGDGKTATTGTAAKKAAVKAKDTQVPTQVIDDSPLPAKQASGPSSVAAATTASAKRDDGTKSKRKSPSPRAASPADDSLDAENCDGTQPQIAPDIDGENEEEAEDLDGEDLDGEDAEEELPGLDPNSDQEVAEQGGWSDPEGEIDAPAGEDEEMGENAVSAETEITKEEAAEEYMKVVRCLICMTYPKDRMGRVCRLPTQ